MQRGTLELTQSEEQVVLENVKESDSVYSKLKSAEITPGNDQVFLSEEEAEYLLDSLPIPDENEKPEVSSLRDKLRVYVQSLRG